VRFDIQPGREGFIDFKSGQESMIYRSKNGHLMVVRMNGEIASFKLYTNSTGHFKTHRFSCVSGINQNQVKMISVTTEGWRCSSPKATTDFRNSHVQSAILPNNLY
jgi:hypothetical protein